MVSKPRPRVVVIGASFAGYRAANLLQKCFDVIVLDAKPYFEFTVAIPRCFVEVEHCKRIIFPHTIEVQVAVVEQVTVTSATGGEVKLQGGQSLRFDYCVICTGSSYPSAIKHTPSAWPSTMEGRLLELQAAAEKLRAASSIVIVGGGAVGVELAAEIVGAYPGKKQVTLLVAKPRLLDRQSESVSSYAATWLESRGVKLRYNTRVQDWGGLGDDAGPATLTTEGGEQLSAQLVYKCVGVQGCAVRVKKEDGSVVGVDGILPVRATLQVQGADCVFAVGDCCSFPEEKTAFGAKVNARAAVINIKRMHKGQQPLNYPSVVSSGATAIPRLVNVSLYKHDGVMEIDGRCKKVMTGAQAAGTKAKVEDDSIKTIKGSWWTKTMMDVFERLVLWILSK